MTANPFRLTASTAPEPIRLVRERKAALALAGLTQADIARKLDVSKQAVGMVIQGVTRNPRIRVAIAEACGMPVEVLFPQTADAERMTNARETARVA